MGTKEVTRTVKTCDVCGRIISTHRDYEYTDDDYFCVVCGKQLCYDCIAKGAGGTICIECIKQYKIDRDRIDNLVDKWVEGDWILRNPEKEIY